MAKVVILDTNVLLSDPNAVLGFPDAEVIIPETVLGELDKLKTARVDPDLRFRGREVSRILFELGEEGSLVEGVALPDGGTLRVVVLDPELQLPDGLNARQSDDRILATALQVCQTRPECDVMLVTNDLNMLLKAQTLGIPVRRHGEGVEGGFARRYIIRPFQRYRVPITILAIAIAVFAAILVIVFWMRPQQPTIAALPAEFQQLLSDDQRDALNALITLQTDPNNSEALLTMGNFYYNYTEQARAANDRAGQIRWAQPGIRYYQRYLRTNEGDLEARADYATLLFYSGLTDRAIQEIGKVLERDPNHLNANYNLGVVLLNGRRDLEGARRQFEKVVELVGTDPDRHGIRIQAQALIEQIDRELAASRGATQGVNR